MTSSIKQQMWEHHEAEYYKLVRIKCSIVLKRSRTLLSDFPITKANISQYKASFFYAKFAELSIDELVIQENWPFLSTLVTQNKIWYTNMVLSLLGNQSLVHTTKQLFSFI